MSSHVLMLMLMFGAVSTAVIGISSIVSDLGKSTRVRMRRRVDEVSRSTMQERVKRSSLFKNLGQLEALASEGEDRGPSLAQRFEAMVEQSAVGLTPRAVLGIGAVAALALGAVGYLVLPSIAAPAIMGPLGAAAPVLFVKQRRDARLEKLLSQLPDAFDLMGRVIRAGQTMSQAFRSVADEFPPPIATEFSFCFEQQNLGIAPATALRDLAQRTGLLDLKILVVGVLVQEQTGGNLAEMLDNLSALIRDRYRLRGMIKTLTAEGRMQAFLLLGLPPAMFLMMLLVNRTYALKLLDHPGLVVATLISEGIGALWIRSIVNFDV